jgi:outer membrane protein
MMALSLSATATTIGKVDIQKVLLTIKQGQAVRTKLKKSFEKKQTLLKKDETNIRKMQQDFQKQSLVMNDSAKAKKQKEIQGAIVKLQQKTQKFQSEIQKMENKLKKPILERVKVIIEAVSKKANVDVTFETSQAPILYTRTEKDLTDDVVKAYNKKHK